MALMAGACTFVIVVVVLVCFVGLIVWVPVTLFVRMPRVLTMHVAGLKALVLARGETLLLVRIVGTSRAVTTLIIFALTTSVVTSHTVQPVRPTLFHKNGGACDRIALEARGASRALRWLGFFQVDGTEQGLGSSKSCRSTQSTPQAS